MNPTGESDSDAVRLGFDRRASVFQRNRKSPNIHTSSGVNLGNVGSTAGRVKGRPDADADAVEETVKPTLEAATQTSATYACSKGKLMLVKSVSLKSSDDQLPN